MDVEFSLTYYFGLFKTLVECYITLNGSYTMSNMIHRHHVGKMQDLTLLLETIVHVWQLRLHVMFASFTFTYD